MKYDFTTMLDRHGMDAIATDPPEGLFAKTDPEFSRIPMWVADMNFKTFPVITEAMRKRLNHPAFGYFTPREEYFNQIIEWQKERNGVEGLTKEAIGYENGVLGGLISAVNVMCSRGDNILLNSPTYIGFTHCLKDNGYNIVLSPLKKDDKGIYRLDICDMERKIVENNIHAAIFCSPHNPCGRVWEKEELEEVTELFKKYDVQVVCDEIWSDLIMPGYKHIPFQSVSEDARQRTVALYAPSKTFNLAGLIGSYHIIYNKKLRERVLKESSLSHYNSMNVLSMYALIGAYTKEGGEWLDELVKVLYDNAEYAVEMIDRHFKGVKATRPEGTYMLFLDCTNWCREHAKSLDWLLAEGNRVGVLWQDGRPFHGECHIRMNLALPAAVVKEAFHRLDRYVFNA